MFDHLLKLRVLALIAFAALSVTCAEEFNGTTYSLGRSAVEITVPVNASGLNLTLQEKARDMSLLDDQGKNVSFNSSYLFWRGEHIYSLTFDGHVSGKLVYTMPQQGQEFLLPLEDERPVRIILPPGYTTGNRVLGIARPEPDVVLASDAGDELIWQNTSGIQYIELSYYKDNAPGDLLKVFSILAAAGVVLLAEYYISIRRLKAISRDAEKRA